MITLEKIGLAIAVGLLFWPWEEQTSVILDYGPDVQPMPDAAVSHDPVFRNESSGQRIVRDTGDEG